MSRGATPLTHSSQGPSRPNQLNDKPVSMCLPESGKSPATSSLAKLPSSLTAKLSGCCFQTTQMLPASHQVQSPVREGNLGVEALPGTVVGKRRLARPNLPCIGNAQAKDASVAQGVHPPAEPLRVCTWRPGLPNELSQLLAMLPDELPLRNPGSHRSCFKC